MVHQVLKFDSTDAFTTWEQEFLQEENKLREEGLMESPKIYSNRRDSSVAVDLRWKSMDSARNYLQKHTYFSKVKADENPRSETIETYITKRDYTMTTDKDHTRLSREGIARLADRGVILTKEKQVESPTRALYSLEENGVKHIETGKIFTYSEVEKTIRKLPEQEKEKIFKGILVTYFK